jgi:hypothetical protein
MSKRDIGQEILDGIRDVKAYQAGTKVLRVHALKEPAPPLHRVRAGGRRRRRRRERFHVW